LRKCKSEEFFVWNGGGWVAFLLFMRDRRGWGDWGPLEVRLWLPRIGYLVDQSVYFKLALPRGNFQKKNSSKCFKMLQNFSKMLQISQKCFKML
jgi:hypothetical protein